MMSWENHVDNFPIAANKHEVTMIMVNGGAVNFHGYRRHSADVDFWIDTKPENLKKLVKTFQSLGYDIEGFPDSVKTEEQNISIKFSQADLNLELITKFSINKSFDQAYEEAEQVHINKKSKLDWRVLSYDSLITGKIKAGRPKDLLDISELQRIREKDD